MHHSRASGAIVVMLRKHKMHGMCQAVGELTEQDSPASRPSQPRGRYMRKCWARLYLHDSLITTEQKSLLGSHDAVEHIDNIPVRHSRYLRPDRQPSA
jgi:hypothetical protein